MKKLLLLSLLALSANAGTYTFMSYNVRNGFGMFGPGVPEKLEAGSLGHLPECAEKPLKPTLEFLRPGSFGMGLLSRTKAINVKRLQFEGWRFHGRSVILAADLNMLPGFPELDVLLEGFVMLTDGKTPTWPAKNPDEPIDQILVDKAHASRVKVLSSSVLPEEKASDHRPIVLKVEIL